MAPLILLLKVSKVVGVAGAITVAANALAYRHFAKKNLAPFENPLDETHEVLATFAIDKDEEDGGFFFALATAPAHVEDKLQDSWLEFAKADAPLYESTAGPSEVHDESIPVGTSEITISEQVEPREESQTQEETKDLSVDVKSEPKSSEETSVTEQEPREELSSSEETSAAEKAPGDTQIATCDDGHPRAEDIQGVKTPSSDTLSEWEVVGDGTEKERGDESVADVGGGKGSENEQATHSDDGSSGSVSKHAPSKASKGTTKNPTFQFSLPEKGKQLAKVAMEAMIRGIEQFTEEEDKVHVAAWHTVNRPEERLRFWSEPDIELQLAQGTNVTVFRMGIDWSRIVPVEPVDGLENVVNMNALNRYGWIFRRVHKHGMRVMVTLFHHSLPRWAAAYGGWKEEKTIKYFVDFARLVVEIFGDLVDSWVTFNEPHVFVLLTYCAGAWPGGDPNLLETATSIFPNGVFKQAMAFMANAHNQVYDIIHAHSKKILKRAKVGVAHHVSFMVPYGLFDVSAVVLSNWMTRFAFVDDVISKLDFIGLNYYGQEVISAPGLKLVENIEFSESGRGVYPDGLYRLLMQYHERYKQYNVPIIITENGVSDASDYIRRPYICEHLLAVRAAMAKGVRIQGYCFWTTSDNWEWADGYGPKFGLVFVDRDKNLARVPRPSYNLFAEIAKTGMVTKLQREKAWKELQDAAAEGRKRPFCRAVDDNNLMYSGGLDVPIERALVARDWRFGHYEPDVLHDPISSFIRFILSPFFRQRRRPSIPDLSSAESEVPKDLTYRALPSFSSTKIAEESLTAST